MRPWCCFKSLLGKWKYVHVRFPAGTFRGNESRSLRQIPGGDLPGKFSQVLASDPLQGLAGEMNAGPCVKSPAGTCQGKERKYLREIPRGDLPGKPTQILGSQPQRELAGETNASSWITSPRGPRQE